jgi:hypothetical protein
VKVKMEIPGRRKRELLILFPLVYSRKKVSYFLPGFEGFKEIVVIFGGKN